MNEYQTARYIRDNYLKPLETYKINNLQDVINLHEELIKVRVDLIKIGGPQFMPHYRGEQNCDWDIITGIYRHPFSDEIDLTKSRIIEEKGAEIFKKKVIENYGDKLIFKRSKKPHGDNWDLLFQAQHAGVKTNLIDLSTSIVHSSFFMCEPSKEFEVTDGQLWCILVPHDYILNEFSENNRNIYPNLNPYNLDSSFVCNVPIYINNIDERTYQFRLFRQNGRLFASRNFDLEVPLNKKEFWKDLILRVKVKAEVKKIIFEELKESGIDKDGLVLTESEKAKKMIEDINNEMKNCS